MVAQSFSGNVPVHRFLFSFFLVDVLMTHFHLFFFCFSPTVRPSGRHAEISSITGLQQQIKAAFGRWRKRGAPSSHTGLEEEVGGGQHQPIREDSFDHPLNVRLSAQSQTFSHPHRLTVFPPFPSGASSSSSSTTTTSPCAATNASPVSKSATSGPKSSSSSSHPFAFVRGLRKRRGGETSESAHQQQQHRHLTDPSSERIRSRTDGGWSNCSFAGQDLGSFPLTSKSRSDHSLHRILKEDNTWTVFATLRPPSGNCHYGVA